MYYNTTELRHYKDFIDNNANLSTAIASLLSPERYTALSEEDRETLRQIGLIGVCSGTNSVHVEIGHKTAQFISYIYELDEIQYIRLERFIRSFESIVQAVNVELIHSGAFNDVVGLQCLYNPNKALTLAGKLPYEYRLRADNIQEHLEYIRDYIIRANVAEKEAAMLLSHKCRHSHVTDYTENMVIMHIEGYKCNIFTI